MALTDFHTWMQNTGKEMQVDENGRRTGIRTTYPAGYSRGQYTDAEARTIAADADYYQSIDKKKKKKD